MISLILYKHPNLFLKHKDKEIILSKVVIPYIINGSKNEVKILIPESLKKIICVF